MILNECRLDLTFEYITAPSAIFARITINQVLHTSIQVRERS